jgi:hypothetical protein
LNQLNNSNIKGLCFNIKLPGELLWLPRCRLPYIFDFKLIFDCQRTSSTPGRNYGEGYYLSLHDALYNPDYTCVLNDNSFETAFYEPTTIVSEPTEAAILSVKSKNSTFPTCAIILLHTGRPE